MQQVSHSTGLRYMKEIDSAAMLTAKMSADVAAEVNLTCMPPPSTNKAVYSGFETQRRSQHKSKTGVLVVPQK